MTPMAEALRHYLARARDRGRDLSPAAEPEGQVVCAACGGAGWVAREAAIQDPQFGRAYPCLACRPPRATSAEMFAAFVIPEGVPPHARSQLRGALRASRAVVESHAPPWLFLAGPNGAGKTHLMRAIGWGLAEQGADTMFWDGGELVEWLRETQRGDSHGPHLLDRMREVNEVSWLLVDDLGKGWMPSRDGASWAWSVLEVLLRRRFDSGLGLVATTNYNPLDPDGPVPPAIRSRLLDGRICEIVSMKDVPDYRAGIGVRR